MTTQTAGSTATVVATANVRSGLVRDSARSVLESVLAHAPDLIGLQEWYVVRRGLLRERAHDYHWYAPLVGGCAVGVRRDRFTTLRSRSVMLSPPGRSDRGGSVLGLEPARFATLVTVGDRQVDRVVSLIDYHLVSGVQSRDRYRDDRPRLVERHRREVSGLVGLVSRRLGRGETVYAVGDSNFHGLRLPGLVSAWSPGDPRATLGPRRQVDDVFGPEAPASVRLVESLSDHRALVVRRSGA